jgi:precorrin-6B methylase 1
MTFASFGSLNRLKIAYAMKNIISDHKSQAWAPQLSSAQIRAARSLIRWTAEDLASASALSVATIRRAELKEDATALTTANDLAIRRALESAGVAFIDENGGGPGVRLRKRRQKKS